eukprot:m.582751 g.582751  ORF g.582751 m.582751 type:complete len:152 (-) comp57947_c0_seq8:1016-1471(-)
MLPAFNLVTANSFISPRNLSCDYSGIDLAAAGGFSADLRGRAARLAAGGTDGLGSPCANESTQSISTSFVGSKEKGLEAEGWQRAEAVGSKGEPVRSGRPHADRWAAVPWKGLPRLSCWHLSLPRHLPRCERLGERRRRHDRCPADPGAAS